MAVEFVLAKYDYSAKEVNELSVRKHERLLLLDDSRNWWRVKNDTGAEGYVPSNYVRREKLFDTLKRKISPMVRKDNTQFSSTSMLESAPKPISAGVPGVGGGGRPPLPNFAVAAQSFEEQQRGTGGNGSQKVQTIAIVKYNFEGSRDDELALTKGEQVTVFEKSNDGWWLGEDSGRKRGWFPSNYVIEQAGRHCGFYSPPDGKALGSLTNGPCNVRGPPQPFRDLPPPPSSAPPVSTTTPPVISAKKGTRAGAASDILERVTALYNFDAQDETELSCVKGEWLDCIGKPADDPEWWMVRNLAGKTGLVPKNYVKVIPDSVSPLAAKERVMNNNSVSQMITVHSSSNSKVVVDSMVHNSQNGLSHLQPAAQPLNPAKIRAGVAGRFKSSPWYFGTLTRDEADQLLSEFGSNGDFLVRDSESNPGDFSISMAAASRNKHFWIRVDRGEYMIGSRRFASVEDIIAHYKTSPIYTNEATGETLFLIRPLPS